MANRWGTLMAGSEEPLLGSLVSSTDLDTETLLLAGDCSPPVLISFRDSTAGDVAGVGFLASIFVKDTELGSLTWVPAGFTLLMLTPPPTLDTTDDESEDLFQHAAEMERDRIKAREDKLNMFKNTDEEEREKLLEDRWQQKIERTLQSKV